ncbi:MAG: AAA family ATPase [Candidatus Hodarchaeales archaeon]
MITNLEITNFKSIKNVKLKCNQFNLLIGEPNTGKSNILEVLGLISCWSNGSSKLSNLIRMQNMSNLFYDELIDCDIKIQINDIRLNLVFKDNNFSLVHEESGSFRSFLYNGEYRGGSSNQDERPIIELSKKLKSYKYKELATFKGENLNFLTPPHGNNLFTLVYSNKRYREIMREFIKDFGYQLVLRPQEKTFEIQKQEKDIIISYPYETTSDTLKTIIFYLFAIFSNQNSIIVFEEPEAHAFPYYTKFLAEKIAIDQSNQYFLVTHNPYFLSSIIEKAPKEKINVYVTYLEDFQTKLKLLNKNKLSEILDFELDPFFNIRALYED